MPPACNCRLNNFCQTVFYVSSFMRIYMYTPTTIHVDINTQRCNFQKIWYYAPIGVPYLLWSKSVYNQASVSKQYVWWRLITSLKSERIFTYVWLTFTASVTSLDESVCTSHVIASRTSRFVLKYYLFQNAEF